MTEQVEVINKLEKQILKRLSKAKPYFCVWYEELGHEFVDKKKVDGEEYNHAIQYLEAKEYIW